MQTKLQELTEKIYQEGVNKATEEGDKIISQAQKNADDILSQAQKDADNLLRQAEKQADELTKNALNELQLTARQAISELKQRVVNLVEAKTIAPEAKEAFKKDSFVQDIIMTIIQNWKHEDSNNVDLSLLLPKQKQEEFEAYFKTKAKELMNQGLEVEYTGKIKGGFKIGPKEGGYLISFSDEDFDNFFRSFMRPRLVELLYGTEQ